MSLSFSGLSLHKILLVDFVRIFQEFVSLVVYWPTKITRKDSPFSPSNQLRIILSKTITLFSPDVHYLRYMTACKACIGIVSQAQQ